MAQALLGSREAVAGSGLAHKCSDLKGLHKICQQRLGTSWMKYSSRSCLSWAASNEYLRIQRSLNLLQKLATSNEHRYQNIKLGLAPFHLAHLDLDLHIFQILKEAELLNSSLDASRA